AQDHADAPRAVVVNETLARAAWPDQDPIGRRMRSGGETSQAPWLTVVGVIKDLRRGEVTRAIRPELYMSSLQGTPRTQMLVVRTAGDPSAILPTLRREVQGMNPQLPLFATGTLDAEFANTLSQPRFRAVLLAGFAVIALLLASIGIYGVTAHAVSQRTQEVGVRMALGAQRSDVLTLILRQHLRPALIGVALGLAGALSLARYLQSMVYGIGATDPVTLVAMGVTLLIVAVAACWIPAQRATRVDALVALRNR
nr:FtsX-like permease family protein [Acidobacteriota bacterium]